MTKYCIEEDCKTRANYNYKELPPKYCFRHKKENMIDVVHKKCIDCNETQPCFNYIGLKPKYCVNCKEDGMVNVVDKKCIDCNTTIPIYNKPGLKALYCFNCKKDDMVNVKDKMCINCNTTKPHFNNPGLKPLYCFNCKKDGMINVVNKLCLLCNQTQAWINNRKYCSPCNATVNPESKQGKKYRFKQNTIVDILKQHFIFDIIDKQIDNGCTNRKPDLIIDCLTHVINIEIDENQHKSKSYTPECEKKRYDEIFTAFADRPLICIRFNPDKYVQKENNFIWSIEGIFKNTGTPTLATKINEKELDERINKLVKEINKSIQNIPEDIFQIKYLFYDN
jgi:hypothetical protein